MYIFVKTLEDEFCEKDGLMDEVMDSFIISVGRIDSSEEDSKVRIVNQTRKKYARSATDAG